MIHKKNLNARLVFAVMVPVSALAFLLGIATVDSVVGHFSIFDGFGLGLVAVGVFLFNIFEDKPQKASIEAF
jgi:hypothetical protein